MKVVINKRYGGFGLSDAAYARLIELGVPVKAYDPVADNEPDAPNRVIFDDTPSPETRRSDVHGQRYWSPLSWDRTFRNDPSLVQVVEELGDKASASLASLRVVEIPDGIEWEIHDYDGIETIHERHRSWG